MSRALTLAVLLLASQTLAAPQAITLGKNGEVGVNFGGYHASAGLGGLLSGGGIGGLHAEAGTPHGQEAKAGLGGSFGEGGTRGGLYAGATAGGGTQAAAGLEGRTGASGAAGNAYSTAQSGGHGASAGLGGENSHSGSAGYSFTASKSFNAGGAVVKQAPEIPPPVLDNRVLPEQPQVVHHKQFELEKSVNVQVAPVVTKTVEYQAPAAVHKTVNVQSEVQTPVIYKEVRVHKPRIHYKPRHHFKTWGNGYFQAGAGTQVAPAEVTKVVHKEVQVPAVEKRVDVSAESSANTQVNVHPASDVGYTKRVTVQKNPQFFADIFNIPIQTLTAVSKLLGNAASGTSVAVEKSGYVHADATPGESTKSVTSQGAVQIKTPSVTSVIDDVFAIPINTLGAVNKFLQNNVPARKTVHFEGSAEGQVGGRAWRRAGRRPVIIREEVPTSSE